MKNKDYIIGKEYEISLMKLSDVKKLIMDNYKLSPIDLFRFYSCIKLPFGDETKIFTNGVSEIGEDLGVKKSKYKYHYLCPNNLYELFRYKEAINNGYIDVNIEEYDYTITENKKKLSSDYLGDLTKDYLDDKEDTFKSISSKYFNDEDIYKKATIDTYIKDRATNLLENSIKVISDNKFFLEAIESSPIVLNRKKDGKYDLIDGFFRTIISSPDIDPVVIVKTYDDLDDKDWFNLMVTFNSWKSNSNEVKLTIDRGFIFGLYTRFGIDPKDYVSCDYNTDIFSIILAYFSDSSSNRNFEYDRHLDVNIMRNCKYFVQDIKSFEKLWKVNPNKNIFERNSYTYFYKILLKFIVSTVGKIRRNNDDIEQNEFNINIVSELLNDKEYNKEFLKLCKMQVPGRIDNTFNKIIGVKTKEYLENMLLNKE